MSIFTVSGELIAIITVLVVIVIGIAISVVILVIVITTVILFNQRIKQRLISSPLVTKDNHEMSIYHTQESWYLFVLIKKLYSIPVASLILYYFYTLALLQSCMYSIMEITSMIHHPMILTTIATFFITDPMDGGWLPQQRVINRIYGHGDAVNH